MTQHLGISVLMPSFNSGEFLCRAVRSVIESRAVVEVLIQDGGSTDGSLEQIRGLDDRIRIQSEPDSGQSEALNRAIGRLNYGVVGWLNADDEYAPGALEKVQEFFNVHPEIDVLYGDYVVIDQGGKELKRYRAGNWSRKSFLSKGMVVFSGSLFLRKSVYDRFGGFDESLQYCMDLDFCLRISSETKAAYLPAVLGKFRVHGDSKTGTGGIKFVREAHALRWKYADGSPIARAQVIFLTIKELTYMLTRPMWWSPFWRRIRSRKQL